MPLGPFSPKIGMHTVSTPRRTMFKKNIKASEAHVGKSSTMAWTQKVCAGKQLELESPFATPGPLAEDLQFCVHTMLARRFRHCKVEEEAVENTEKKALTDVMSWDDELLSKRYVSSTKVASHLSPSAHKLTR